MKIKQYLDEFAVLRMADLYRHLFGPKGDRLCRFHPDPAGYRLTWRQGDDILSLDCHLVNQRLMVRTSIMPDAIEIPLTSYRQGIYGGVARYAFACPECSRRVFHLYAPSPGRLIRPDGTMNRPEPLCHQCHGLSYPSWRYGGTSRERAMLQRQKLSQKLGPNPTERLPAVSVTRHMRRFSKWLKAEERILGRGLPECLAGTE